MDDLNEKSGPWPCPACGSERWEFTGVHREERSYLVSKIKCRKCGHHWDRKYGKQVPLG